MNMNNMKQIPVSKSQNIFALKYIISVFLLNNIIISLKFQKQSSWPTWQSIVAENHRISMIWYGQDTHGYTRRTLSNHLSL